MPASRYAVSAQERRVKRLARRFGLTLVKNKRPSAKSAKDGGYMLRNDDTRRIVFGDVGGEFSATLDETEDFLLLQSKPRGQD